MRADDLLGDGQPQTRAAGPALAAGVETHETLEDPITLGGWDPRSVVGHLDARLTV